MTVDYAVISGCRLALPLVHRSRGCQASVARGTVVCVCLVIVRATGLGRL
jgi:hypothetical protein